MGADIASSGGPESAFLRLAAAARAAPDAPWSLRRDRLDRLGALIRARRKALAAAIRDDFGQRPAPETELAEVFPLLNAIAHARRHGPRWMAPRRVPAGLMLAPSRAELLPRPLGVVGIVAPWNYPLLLSAGPLVAALAAGNRALLKLSEHAPAFADTLAEALRDSFDADEVAAITGPAEVARAFCALPFDHLLFTGSTNVGRQVMAAAAANLTPVTLELGGKSPALIAPDVTGARLARAAARIMAGKMLNAGQTCIAPDHVWLPRAALPDFLAAARAFVARAYPRLAGNPDYARIISPAQFARLAAWLEAAGGEVHALSDAAPDAARRLMPPLAVTGADPASALMTQEIFGPILPLIAYDSLAEAAAAIAAAPRPLAFYPFTDDAPTRQMLLARILAGGVTVNDTLLHVAAESLPFGGVGASGMGAWHGQAGFDRLSHLMPVLRVSRWTRADLLAPPYGARLRRLLAFMTPRR